MIDKIYKKSENEVYIIFDNKPPMKVVSDNGTAMSLLLSILEEGIQSIKINNVDVEITKYETV